MMSIRIFVLPTQYDIIDFRQGRRPENILMREFASTAELQAYENGIDAIEDQYDRIQDLRVIGSRVVHHCRSEDPEVDGVLRESEVEFATTAEVVAYCRGLDDAEGYAAPLLVDQTDDRFEQLLVWNGTS